MKPTKATKPRPSQASANLNRMWEQACKEAREARAQKQRSVEAMFRAGNDHLAPARATEDQRP